MSQRIIIVLALLLAVGAVGYLLMSGGSDAVEEPETIEIRRGAPSAPRPPEARQLEADPSDGEPESQPNGNARPASTGGSAIGLRVPEGVDLRDPEQVRALLRDRLATTPTNWKDVARLVGLLHEPLDAETRERLLTELTTGRRGLVLKVFQEAQDATLVPDLLARLDDESVVGNARSAVLTALATLPGAEASEVVLGLESRLSGEVRKDAIVLRAIGQRGGAEAARAITEYILESEDPRAVASRGTLRLELKDDPEATAVLAEALKDTRAEAPLGALIRLATQPGAVGVVSSLVALDSTKELPAIRGAALRALAVIGTEDAVSHVLQAADGSDDAARQAAKSLGVMTAADPGARQKLLESLEKPGSGTHADDRRLETLRALANLKHAPAKDAFVAALDDRDVQVQQVAVQGLGRMGAASQDRVDDLVRVFASGSESVQRSVVVALGQIGGDDAAGVLRQMQGRTDLSTSVQRAVRMAVRRTEKQGEANERDERLGAR